ncbi:hypothetical protein [Roseovarius sp.]|uniref:hypothetical protein n=1 Tax=Roseovarius sp. TaxID=1486281 RepID=UPI003B5B6C3B
MEDIIALLMALTAPERDGRYFETLLARGEGAPVEIVSCRDPMAMSEIVGETILCGTVTVPEDHDAPENGQSVELAFAILRSETTYPARTRWFTCMAGPGSVT